MPLRPFSDRYPNEFLSRKEDNFSILLQKLDTFYKQTRNDIGDGTVSRRRLDSQFNYEEELQEVSFSQQRISTEEVALEFNEMISGSMRHNDPTKRDRSSPRRHSYNSRHKPWTIESISWVGSLYFRAHDSQCIWL